MKPQIVAVIPARWKSTRFPGKPLALIAGKPMIQWVVEQCRKAGVLADVWVATDDRRILAACHGFGGQAVMTRSDHASGTDRIAEVARKTRADIFINVQGDEPLISPRAIHQLCQAIASDRAIEMATLACPLESAEEKTNPNVVKVVVNRAGNALYFSRSMIPFVREPVTRPRVKTLKHIGLYAYRREFLLRWPRWRPTPLECAEKLEQLRALENGVAIRVVESRWESLGVDVPADLAKVEMRLRS